MKKFISIGLLACWLGVVGSGCQKGQPLSPGGEAPPTGPTGLPATAIAESWEFKVKGRQVQEWVVDLNGSDSSKYPAAIKALTEAGPKAVAAVTDLKNRLADTGPGTRAYRILIIKALGAIGPDAAPAVPNMLTCLARDDKEFSTAVNDAVQKIGTAAIPALIDGLKNSDLDRPSVADVLAGFGPRAKDAVPTLIDVIKAEPRAARLRVACANALGAIGPDAKDATAVLKEMAKDKNDTVKKSAEDALVKIEGKKS